MHPRRAALALLAGGATTGVTAVLGLVVLVALASGPAAAQTDAGAGPPAEGEDAPAGTEEAPSPPMTVVEQTAWVEQGGTFRLLLAAPQAADDATLTVTVHDAVGSRIAFSRTVTGEELGGEAVALDTVPVGLLPRDTGNTISVALGPDVTGQLDGAGVYPVDVVLRDAAGAVVHQLVTHLVRLPADLGSPPLRVATVLPLDASPALQPDGTTVIGAAALAGLRSAADALTEHPGLPLTVDPSPETVQALAEAEQPDLAAVVEQLATGLVGTGAGADVETPPGTATRQVLGGTFADLDVAAWVATELGDAALAEQITAGTAAVDTTLDVRSDRRSWVVDGLTTPPALSRLGGLGVDQVVLPQEALFPLDAEAFPVALTQPFEVATGTDEVQRAASADTALLAHLGSTGDPVLDAHHLLADLSVLYFDRPALSRGVPVPLPADAPLPPAFLDTFLDALAEPQLVLAGVTLDTLFAVVPTADAGGERETTGQPLVRNLVPTEPASLGDYPSDLALTQLTLLGYESLVGPELAQLALLERLTLVSGDASLDAEGRRAYLASVSDGIEGTVDAITTPEDQTITLTSRSGTIPLRLRNDNAFPVNVVVDLRSERLEFPDGEQLTTTLPPGDTELDVRVRTRASGAFPLEARVSSPDGIVEIASTEYRVRSTALSGVGVVLSVGAGLILLVWWARHFRSLRRNRALVAAGAHPAGSEPTGTTGTTEPTERS